MNETHHFALLAVIATALPCACQPPATVPTQTVPTATAPPDSPRSAAPVADPAEPRPPEPETPAAPYCADPETHRFHIAECANRDSCSVPIATPSSALSQGNLPGESCRPPMQPPLARPGTDACEQDSDCRANTSRGCGCPPCGYEWPRPMNATHYEWLMGQYAIESCPPMDCQTCDVPSGYLEVRPVCVDARCTLSY